MTNHPESLSSNKQRLVSDLAESTGVSSDDVTKILEKLGFDKSMRGLEELVGSERLFEVGSLDIVAGVKFAETLIHK
jgi:hypothetical protein